MIRLGLYSLLASIALVLFAQCTSGKSSGSETDPGDSAQVAAGVVDGKLVFPPKPSMMVSDFAGVLTDSIRGL